MAEGPAKRKFMNNKCLKESNENDSTTKKKKKLKKAPRK